MECCIIYAYVLVVIKLISSVRRIIYILFCHTLLALKSSLDVSIIIVSPRPKIKQLRNTSGRVVVLSLP